MMKLVPLLLAVMLVATDGRVVTEFSGLLRGLRSVPDCQHQEECVADLNGPFSAFYRAFRNNNVFNTGAQAQEDFCGEAGIAERTRQCLRNVNNGRCQNMYANSVYQSLDFICSADARASLTAMDGTGCNGDLRTSRIYPDCMAARFQEDGTYCDWQAANTVCLYQSLSAHCVQAVADFVRGFKTATRATDCQAA